MFWQKKKITSEEYADLLTRIGALRADIETLKYQVEKMELRITTAKRRDKLEDDSPHLDKDELQSLKDFVSQMGYIPKD